jgi:hypothetical protein
MTKKKTENRGRKPTDDPKELVRLYVNRSIIKKLGGHDAVRELAYGNITSKARMIP